jgi:hypothetical protein
MYPESSFAMTHSACLRLLPTAACRALIAAAAVLTPLAAGAQPAATSRDAAAFRGLSARIDARIDEVLAARGLPASPPAVDAAFFRRLSIVLTGCIPAPDDVIGFLEDRDPAKRAKAVDALLASPAWAEHRAGVWTTLLVGRDINIVPQGAPREALRDWLRDRFASGAPFDATVRELVSARSGPAAYYRSRFAGSPVDATGHIARTFCGLQLQCAQCHNHPYEKWTREDFFGLAAFFAGEGDDLPDAPSPLPPPRFLTGEAPAPGADPGAELARMIAGPANPWFAPAAVNRVWAGCFGRGLVEPVDDFRAGDGGTHPELLRELADAFAAGGYDVRALLRAILNTRAWQRSSRPLPGNGDDPAWYSRAEPRPLTPEELFDSLLRATGVMAPGRGQPAGLASEARRRLLTRFVFLLGDDEQREVADFDDAVPAALLLINGPYANSGKLVVRERDPLERGMAGPAAPPRATVGRTPETERAGVSTIDALFLVDMRVEDRLEQLFVTVLSRPPTAEERERMLAHVRRKSALPALQREAFKDVAWALLNSAEFRCNY